MGIHLTVRLDTGHKATRRDGICFSVMQGLYDSARTKALSNPMYGLDFGFDVELGLGADSEYLSHNNLKARRKCDEVFNLLFGKWLDGKIIQDKDKRSGTNKRIVFIGSRCSTYHMIIATGIYRHWTDYPSFFKVWDKLEPYNLHPWVRFAVVNSMNLMRDSSLNLSAMPIRTNAQHTCIPSGIMDDRLVSKFMAGKFPEHPPMSFTARCTGQLSYVGRDAWLSKRTYSNWGSGAENYNFLTTGRPRKYKKSDLGSKYTCARTIVNVEALLNDVIIPKFGGTVV